MQDDQGPTLVSMTSPSTQLTQHHQLAHSMAEALATLVSCDNH